MSDIAQVTVTLPTGVQTITLDSDSSGVSMVQVGLSSGSVSLIDSALDGTAAAQAAAETAQGLAEAARDTAVAAAASVDLPSITGNALKYLRANAGETALEYSEVSSGGGTAAEITYSNAGSGLTSTNVQDAIDEIAALEGKHSFCAVKSADQTGISAATWTKITFTTEEYDTGSVYDAANSKLTPGRAGVWAISALVNFTAGLVDQSAYQVAIYKNGTIYKASYARESGKASLSAQISFPVVVDADDYIEIYASGAGTGDKTVGSAAHLTSFSGVEIEHS